MVGEDTDTDNPRSFQKAAWWKRFIILVAGAAMNFLVGVLIVAVVLFWQPRYATPQLTSVDINSYQLGYEAAVQVINHAKNPDLTATKIIIPHRILERSSCLKRDA